MPGFCQGVTVQGELGDCAMDKDFMNKIWRLVLDCDGVVQLFSWYETCSWDSCSSCYCSSGEKKQMLRCVAERERVREGLAFNEEHCNTFSFLFYGLYLTSQYIYYLFNPFLLRLILVAATTVILLFFFFSPFLWLLVPLIDPLIFFISLFIYSSFFLF